MHEDVKDLAEQYKQRLEQQKLDQQTFLAERKLLETNGPKLWADLRSLIKSKQEALNSEMGFEAVSWNDTGSESLSMTRKHDGATLTGDYNSILEDVRFKCPEAKIDVFLELRVQSGDVEFISINANKVVFVNKPEDIAQGLIRQFLTQ